MRDLLTQPIVVVIPCRQIERAPQQLEHLRLVSKFEFTCRQLNTRLRFVIVLSVCPKILERRDQLVLCLSKFALRNSHATERKRGRKNSNLILALFPRIYESVDLRACSSGITGFQAEQGLLFQKFNSRKIDAGLFVTAAGALIKLCRAREIVSLAPKISVRLQSFA